MPFSGNKFRYYNSITNYLLCAPGTTRTDHQLQGRVIIASTNGITNTPLEEFMVTPLYLGQAA
jgi:hypothetical protein